MSYYITFILKLDDEQGYYYHVAFIHHLITDPEKLQIV